MLRKTALAALALTMMAIPAVADISAAIPEGFHGEIPKGFHGDWCPIAGAKDELYRRGKCPKGIRLSAGGISTKDQNCVLTNIDVGPKAFEVDFACEDKRGRETGLWEVWMRENEQGQLNIWTRQ
jgi:hypothetical protein